MDGWETIHRPNFASGPQEITAYAVDPYDPAFIFVTNGVVVMRSVDGGRCFEEVFADFTPSVDLFAQEVITALEVPASPDAHSRVYAIVSTPFGPQVFASTDHGTTWSASSSGLAPTGVPIELVVAEGSPDVLYLLVEVGSTGSVIYKSTDAGANWELLPNAAAAVAGAVDRVGDPVSDIAVDPMYANVLWATSDAGLYGSEDGGRTWDKETEIRSPLKVLVLSHIPGRPARIIAFSSPADHVRFAYWSRDGGDSWEVERGTPGSSFVESAAHNADESIVISVDAFYAEVYGYSPPGPWNLLTWVTSLARPPFRDLTADRAATSSFYAHTPDAVMRYRGPFQEPPSDFAESPPRTPGQRDCPPLEVGEARAPRLSPSSPSLAPADVRVVLSPGETKRVPYELELPAAHAIDLFFLIDASGSMKEALCGVAHGSFKIANALADKGLDVNFGAGTYQHFSVDPYHDDSDSGRCYAYRRDADIGPLSVRLAEALFRVQPCGGREPQMTALYQMATGEGQYPWIAAGQNANFRDKAIPVVVHISDEPLSKGGDLKTKEETVKLLNERGIRQVGIDFEKAEWLEDLALRTHAVAAPPGVDCDADGVIDIPASAPLVCAGTRSGPIAPLAGPILNMVLALRDEAPVGLVERSDSGVVDRIDPDIYPAINLRAPHTLAFGVNYTCQPEQIGKSFPVRLAAQVRSVPVATASALVICQGPGVSSSSSALRPGAAPLQPPLPPFHIPQLQPNPQPQPRVESQAQQQIQQQGQAQAQGVFVPQRQMQPQMAFVHAAQEVKDQLAMGNAMVNARKHADPSAGIKLGVGLATLSMMIAFGYVAVTARRLRTVAIDRFRG